MDVGEERKREGDASGKGDFVLRGVVKVTSPLSRRRSGRIKQTDVLGRGPKYYGTPSIADCDLR